MTQPLSDVQAVPSTQARPLPPLEEPGERIIVPAKRRLKLRDIFGESVGHPRARGTRLQGQVQAVAARAAVARVPAARAARRVRRRVPRAGRRAESSGVPYAVFALVGLTAWAFFQASMTIGVASLITNTSFIRYTPCPRPAFPLAAIIASLPSFAVTGGRRGHQRRRHRSPLPARRAASVRLGVALPAHCGRRRHRRVARGQVSRHHQRAAVPAPDRRVLRAGRVLARRAVGSSCGRSSSSIR